MMLLGMFLSWALTCLLFTAKGSSQTPPAQCVRTHTISNEDDIYIMPGVVNCFMCDLPGVIAWQVEENRDLVLPSQSPNAEAVGDFLVIASPDTYMTPGTSGRRDIVCTSLAEGRNYEVRLASPILTPPSFLDATVNEGELLKITCLTRNIPDISTFEVLDPNGRPVDTVFGVFTVPNVTRAFAGTYTCVVRSTRDNSSVNATSTVVIWYAPQVTASNSTSPRIVLGEELRLQCNYVGVPAPSIQWFHNGVLLRNGVDGAKINTSDNISSILIDAVQHSNGGTYTCRANNTLGDDQESYSVMILDISISIQVQALCLVVVWYNPDVSCERMITGYDVRFYSPHSDTKNVTRRTGANQTFYIIQNEDGLADKHDINVQVRAIHRIAGEWSKGISLGCEMPTNPPEAPSVYFELNGVVYANNSAVSLLEVGEGENALLCKTNMEGCCGTPPNRFGEFYYPNGIKVPIAKQQQGFYRNRGEKVIRLNRRDGATSPTGRYRCEIPDASGSMQSIYITLSA